MPSRRCSRIDFRKSRRSISFFLMIVAAVQPIVAQVTHEEQVLLIGPSAEISIEVEGYDRGAFFANLYEGMTARIEYQIRVSVPREEPFHLLGPRLLHEVSLSRSVYFDRFSELFQLSGTGRVVRPVESEEELLARFFSLVSYAIEIERLRASGFPETDTYVVETQVIYNPILFVPALRILSVFLSDDEIVTNRRSFLLAGVGQ